MASDRLLKRSILIAFFVVLIILIVVLIRIHTYAWPWLALQANAKVACEETAWSMALMVDMVSQLENFYLPHAEALLTARQQLAVGNNAGQILKDLSIMPGVTGSFVADIDGEIYQYPPGAYHVDDFTSQIKEYEKEATMYTHPIMFRKVGGLTRFVKWKAGKDSLDLMVCYGQKSDQEKRVLGLVLDPAWLLNQIPAFMDSITKQDELLLFWSRPTAGVAEQTIGITFKGDTLWWDNNPSLEVKYYSQPVWLLNDLWVHGRQHYIRHEDEYKQHMPGVRFYFYAAEGLFVLLVILALFVVRPEKESSSRI
jgi:hypothetical protein